MSDFTAEKTRETAAENSLGTIGSLQLTAHEERSFGCASRTAFGKKNRSVGTLRSG
jgi:hypothetical protein